MVRNSNKPVLHVRVMTDLCERDMNDLYDKLEPLSRRFELIITGKEIAMLSELVEFGKNSVFEYMDMSIAKFVAMKKGKHSMSVVDRLNKLGADGWCLSNMPRSVLDSSTIIFQRVKREL